MKVFLPMSFVAGNAIRQSFAEGVLWAMVQLIIVGFQKKPKVMPLGAKNRVALLELLFAPDGTLQSLHRNSWQCVGIQSGPAHEWHAAGQEPI